MPKTRTCVFCRHPGTPGVTMKQSKMYPGRWACKDGIECEKRMIANGIRLARIIQKHT